MCAITKNGDDNKDRQETHLLKVKTSKIEGAGKGVFAAKSFEKDEIISVYLGKKSTTITPYTLKIQNMLISPDKEETWLGAHFMNDRNFKTSTTTKKVGHPICNNAYFEGVIVRARRRIREGEEITLDYNSKETTEITV